MNIHGIRCSRSGHKWEVVDHNKRKCRICGLPQIYANFQELTSRGAIDLGPRWDTPYWFYEPPKLRVHF